jgi:hypothetical protein
MSEDKKADGTTVEGSETDENATADSETPPGTTSAGATSYQKVIGETSMADAAGVYGHTSASTGQTYGVAGETDSSGSGAAGVRGDATAGSGATFGVHGFADSTNDASSGVYGEANDGGTGLKGDLYVTKADLPPHIGLIDAAVHGRAEGTNNTAGFLWSRNATGVTGRTDSADASAVIGYNSAGGIGLQLNNSYVDIGKVSVSAYLSSSQSIDSRTNETVAFNSLEFTDWNGSFDTSTGVFTAPADGKYHVAAGSGWLDDLADGDKIFLYIYANGDRKAKNYRVVGGSVSPNMHVSKTVSIAKGDTIEVEVFHTNGSSRSLAARDDETYVTIDKIG